MFPSDAHELVILLTERKKRTLQQVQACRNRASNPGKLINKVGRKRHLSAGGGSELQKIVELQLEERKGKPCPEHCRKGQSDPLSIGLCAKQKELQIIGSDIQCVQ